MIQGLQKRIKSFYNINSSLLAQKMIYGLIKRTSQKLSIKKF